MYRKNKGLKFIAKKDRVNVHKGTADPSAGQLIICRCLRAPSVPNREYLFLNIHDSKII